jgi:hypothetical protein
VSSIATALYSKNDKKKRINLFPLARGYNTLWSSLEQFANYSSKKKTESLKC